MTDKPAALVQLFRQTGQFSTEEMSDILRLWHHPLDLERGEFLSTPDRRDHYIYFVISGVLRIYCVDRQGEEVCLGFSYDNSVTGSFPSLIRGEPGKIYVQALSQCQLLGALWKDFTQLAERMPKLERWRRIFSEETLLGRMDREIEMLTLPAEQRYERLLQRSPHLFQFVPLKYIASYLGMKPETLSRIRRNYAKQ